MSDNHKAIIARVYTRKHPNADKLLLANSLGYQLIVGLDTVNGELGILFPEGLQLSEEYAQFNDLIRRKDSNGKPAGGMFDNNRRVRVQRFRGEKSEAYWASLSSLVAFGDISTLQEGDLLDEFNGIQLCRKYLTAATQSQKSSKVRREELPALPKHIDTPQFKREGEKIPAGAMIYVTLKCHGTSQRVCRTKVERKLSFFERIKAKLGFRVDSLREELVTGTRNVIVSNNEGFHSNEMRAKASSLFEGKLPLNLAVYFEVVGWDGNKPIMPTVSTKCLGAEFVTKYGHSMTYKYGCPIGEIDVYVYRMLFTTEDGHRIELPWSYVKDYCNKLEIKSVPELIEPFIYDGNLEELTLKLESLVDGPDPIDASHIREGIVIRWEKGLDWGVQKWKSFNFLEMEHVAKDSDNYVDMEEVS